MVVTSCVLSSGMSNSKSPDEYVAMSASLVSIAVAASSIISLTVSVSRDLMTIASYSGVPSSANAEAATLETSFSI